MLKIGDKLWKLDKNRSIRSTGKGEPSYSEFFIEHSIIGETRGTWLVGRQLPGFQNVKIELRINKHTLRTPKDRNGWCQSFYNEADKNDMIWRDENRSKIINAVERATTGQLRQVAWVLSLNGKDPCAGPDPYTGTCPCEGQQS